jgi:leucyl-tRNA synthetase
VAGAREDDAGQLDRQEVGVRFAFTHDIRGDDGSSSTTAGCTCSPPAPTRSWASPSARCAAEHPLAAHAAKSNPELAAFIDECNRGSVIEADMATMEKKGMPTGSSSPSAHRRKDRGLGRQLRADELWRRRGDGCARALTSAISSSRKSTAADQAGDRRSRRDVLHRRLQPWYEDKATAGAQLRQVRRLPYEAASTPSPPIFSAKGWAKTAHRVPAARLGHFAAALLGHADPDRPLRELRRRAVAGSDCRSFCRGLRSRRQRQPARQARRFRQLRLSELRAACERETDTMDTFVDSSWYYMRYAARCDSRRQARWSIARNDYWIPMDQYIGGITHAILHLLYARFWTKVMRDMGLVHFDEPFTRLLTQGMVLNHSFFRRSDKGCIDYFAPESVESSATPTVTSSVGESKDRLACRSSTADSARCPKSKLNGVDPRT